MTTWTKQEIDYLKNNYVKLGIKYCVNYLQKPYNSVRSLAYRLNIALPKNYWKSEEINYLKNNYSKLDIKIIAQHLHHTKISIQRMAVKLKITQPKRIIPKPLNVANKVCCGCMIEKPKSEFTRNKKNNYYYSYCRDCNRARTKAYNICHPNRIIDYRRNNRQALSKYNYQYRKNRMKTDVGLRLLRNIRARLSRALKNNNKSQHTMELIGCNISELKNYLENIFTTGMTWENYGKWHIDHIKPCASFDLSEPEEQKACFNFHNLQPLWAAENWSKGSKIIPPAI